MILLHGPLGHHMLLMDSMSAPHPITTVVCVPATQRFRFSDTWHSYPSHCQVSTTLEHNITLLAAANLLQQPGRAIPTRTTAKLKHLSTIHQLTTIMSGQPNAPPSDPTSPRVVPATPSRLAVAAPPRVATTSNTITAPNTIRQLPIVHQRLTRHNNPFQILVDNDGNNDANMVVASNCSPQTPHPTQRQQTIQPPSQPPTTVPTTVWRPPPLCPQMILVPSQSACPLPPMILMSRSRTIRPRAPPTTSPQTLLFLPPVAPSVTPHDLWPHRYNTVPTHTPTATPHYNFIGPDENRNDCPTTRSSTPPR
jgi:hypothetical protein